jgi:signal transduction histidine kinase
MEPDFLDVLPVDLRSFCADVVDACTVLADRAWRLGDVPDAVVAVDEAKLRGALLNLVDNAVRATRPGDVIAVSAATTDDGGVTLFVDDSGPGIAAADRSEVLRRFARPGAADSDGSGLGLAIVSAVADAHGGRVQLLDSPYGGLRVAIVLPPRIRMATAAP